MRPRIPLAKQEILPIRSVMKIEIEVLHQEELTRFDKDCDLTWACQVIVDDREPIIFTSDGSTTWHAPTWRDGV
jgi:hypothetical protein